MVELVLPAKLVATREGKYTMYVFKNAETNEFIMCTKLPNWNTPEVFIGDVGFLQIEVDKAGEEYFDVKTTSEDFFAGVVQQLPVQSAQEQFNVNGDTVSYNIDKVIKEYKINSEIEEIAVNSKNETFFPYI